MRSSRPGRVCRVQHSPSSAANPQILRVNRDLVLGERFREDVRGHILRGGNTLS